MKCPKCDNDRFIVVDSRPSKFGPKRTRLCLDCKYRMRTIELPDSDLASSYAVRKECMRILKEAFDKIKYGMEK
jgi:transcriptional regulator NrdR family protein